MINAGARMNAVDYLNSKIVEHLGPKIVCRLDDGKWACDEHTGFTRATHKAYLIGIEESVG